MFNFKGLLSGAKLSSLFSIAIILSGAASVWSVPPAIADRNIRPYKDDAGLFDPVKETVNIQFQLLKDTRRIEIGVRDFRGQIVVNFY